MKASTQLIGESTVSGISSLSHPTSWEYLTSLLTNTRLHFLETIAVFWTTDVVLRSARVNEYAP
jgi:hypothetical protein